MILKNAIITLLLVVPTFGYAQLERPHITTTGQAELRVDADMAEITLQAQSFATDRNQAKKLADETVNKVIKAAGKLGIKKEDIIASNLNVNPRYRYEKNRSRILEGYDAYRPITVSLRDLDKLDAFLNAVLSAEVDQVGQTVLKNSDAEKYQQQARLEAIADSKAKAKFLANAYDAKLGPIFKIAYYSSQPINPVRQRTQEKAMMSADFDSGGGEYLHDKVVYRDNIEVIFDLIPESKK